MQQSTFLAAFALDFGIQIVGWLIAVALKTDKTYDMFGSATFFSVSLLTLFLGGHASTWRNMLISLCVCTVCVCVLLRVLIQNMDDMRMYDM